jgi:hypothetical protein
MTSDVHRGAHRRATWGHLARLAAKLFLVWGVLVSGKGLWDAFAGEPEANFYSPKPWEFVTREQWARYAGFELAYGLACVGMGAGLLKWAGKKKARG